MFDAIIGYLNKKRGVNFSLKEKAIYTGEIDIKDEKVCISIDLGQGFPDRFPVLSIENYNKFIPHVSSEGRFCLFDESSIMVKHDMPEQILLDSFDRVLEILTLDNETRKKEVFREFSSYWESISSKEFILYTNLPIAKEHEFQEYVAVGDEKGRFVVSNSVEDSKAMLVNYWGCRFADIKNHRMPCFRIRLRSSSLPLMSEQLTWKSMRHYIHNNITASQKRQFNHLFSGEYKRTNCLVLLSIPSDYGDQFACVWIHHTIQKGRGSLKSRSVIKADSIITIRIDSQYMLVRGGAETNLSHKSVLLIGCGSVGGFLADNLCQCGIGELAILDKDILLVDNVHRHVLGFDNAIKWKNKADLLQRHLESRFPYVFVDNLSFADRTAESFINDEDRLDNYDLIISATGDPTLDLKINETLRKAKSTTPLVVCFNEPYGIGGHAVAVLNKGGCLRCLYSDSVSGELVPFLGSLVKEGQSFLKNLSGCSSAYVEYSVLDSQQTAIIASRLIIDVLNGRCDHTRLVSWVGSDEKLRGAGFQPSEYYDEIKNKSIVTCDISCAVRCQVCGN